MIPQRLEQRLVKNLYLDYLLATPTEPAPAKDYPLVISLHGRGESSPDLDAVKRHGISTRMGKRGQVSFYFTCASMP
ncbi:MAG: hypothetical protein ACRCYY_05655 [Trueperaceae bacterium]